MPAPLEWSELVRLDPWIYHCGHCNAEVGSDRGIHDRSKMHRVYICPICKLPTYVDRPRKIQVPGAPFGGDVEYVPPESAAIYREARNCMTVSAYTAAVLLCRKLLMHVAVTEGAPEGATFVAYIDHLVNVGGIAPRSRAWVDRIRQKGNEANHEIAPITRTDAEELITFSEMVLKLVYEFPGRITPPTP